MLSINSVKRPKKLVVGDVKWRHTKIKFLKRIILFKILRADLIYNLCIRLVALEDLKYERFLGKIDNKN